MATDVRPIDDTVAVPLSAAPAATETPTARQRRSRGWRGAIVHVAALVILAALPLLASWTLLTPKLADRHSIAPGDFYDVHYPFHLAAVRAWQHGGPLLWTPAIDAGQPAFADIQFDVFYPVTVLTGLLLGPEDQLTPDFLIKLDVAHVFVGELGMYLLVLWLLGARRASLGADQFSTTAPPPDHRSLVSASSPRPADALVSTAPRPTRPSPIPAALVGAVIFAFSGYLTTYPLQDVNILQVSVWLPWCLLLLDQALVRRSTPLAIVAGLPVGLAVLSGHPQVLLYLVCALVLYVVVFASARARQARAAVAALARGALTLVVGLAAGAVQLVPTLQLAPYTVRGAETYDFLSGGFLPHELVGLFLPRGFDGATPLYLGAAALTLAIVGLGAGPRDLRAFAAVLGALSLPLSLGKYAALYPLAYLAIPGFAQVRDQERAIYLLTVSVALLAANGVYQALQQGHTALRPLVRLLSFGLAAGLAAGGAVSLALTTQLHWGLAAPVVEGLSVAREGLDWALLVAGATLVILGVASSVPRPVPALAWALVGVCAVDLLGAHPSYGAVAGTHEPYPVSPLVQQVQADGDQPFRINSEGLLPAGGNAGLIYGLEDTVGGTPLELQLYHAINQLPELQRDALFGVRYVFTKRASLGDHFTLLGQQGDVRLFRLSPDLAMPRAWLVHRVVVAPEAALWATLAGADLRHEVVTSSSIPVAAGSEAEDTVSVTEPNADQLTIDVRAGSAGVLVISEIRYPGWHVTVDGQPAPLLPVDGAVYGLALGPGAHAVSLRFQPASLLIGATISGITLLALAMALVLMVQRARQLGTVARPHPTRHATSSGTVS